MGITGDACRERRKLRNLDDLIRAPRYGARGSRNFPAPSAILIANLEPEPEKPTFDCSGPGRAGPGQNPYFRAPSQITEHNARPGRSKKEEKKPLGSIFHFPWPFLLPFLENRLTRIAHFTLISPISRGGEFTYVLWWCSYLVMHPSSTGIRQLFSVGK